MEDLRAIAQTQNPLDRVVASGTNVAVLGVYQ